MNRGTGEGNSGMSKCFQVFKASLTQWSKTVNCPDVRVRIPCNTKKNSDEKTSDMVKTLSCEEFESLVVRNPPETVGPWVRLYSLKVSPKDTKQI